MNKISFEQKDCDLLVGLHTPNSINIRQPTTVKDVILNRSTENARYELIIKHFFSNYSKRNSLNIELTDQETTFGVFYDHYNDSLKFIYGDTKDRCVVKREIGHVSYGIGKETITEVLIKNFADFLEKRSEIITEKYLVDSSDRGIIDFYLDKLRKFEAYFSGDNKDKVSKAREYLDYISKSFPLINELYIHKIRDFLKGVNVQELEECVESITGLQGKVIRLEPLRREVSEDKTEEYIEKYESEEEHLTEVFDESDIEEIPEIKEAKITKLKAQLPRVRRILEIHCRYAPPQKKKQIEQYITVIKNFERKEYYVSDEDRVSTLRSLLDIFSGAGGISTLITGVPLVLFDSVIKIIKSILSLNDLNKEYWKKTQTETDDEEEDDSYPAPTIERLERQPELRRVTNKRMIVQIVESIIREHGPSIVHKIKAIAKDYNYELMGAQIEHAVYGSDRFYPHGKKRIRYNGVYRNYKIYYLRRSR